MIEARIFKIITTNQILHLDASICHHRFLAFTYCYCTFLSFLSFHLNNQVISIVHVEGYFAQHQCNSILNLVCQIDYIQHPAADAFAVKGWLQCDMLCQRGTRDLLSGSHTVLNYELSFTQSDYQARLESPIFPVI